MEESRVAVITDIHGNLPALEAALERIDRLDVESIYCGGDLVGYGAMAERGLRADSRARHPDASTATTTTRSAATRRTACAPTRTSTIANWASFPSTGPSSTPTGPPRTTCASCLSICASSSVARRVRLVHGSPRKVNEYLFEDKPAKTFERIAAGSDCDVLVFGHTHKPWIHEYGGVLFVNCGSVGKPKDGNPGGALPCWRPAATESRHGSSGSLRRRVRGRPGGRVGASRRVRREAPGGGLNLEASA